MRRRILLWAASLVVIGGIAIAIWGFPTRWGCDDGNGYPAPSEVIARQLCANPDSPLLVAVDRRAGQRLGVLFVTVVVTTVLLRLGSDDADPGERQRLSREGDHEYAD